MNTNPIIGQIDTMEKLCPLVKKQHTSYVYIVLYCLVYIVLYIVLVITTYNIFVPVRITCTTGRPAGLPYKQPTATACPGRKISTTTRYQREFVSSIHRQSYDKLMSIIQRIGQNYVCKKY